MKWLRLCVLISISGPSCLNPSIALQRPTEGSHSEAIANRLTIIALSVGQGDATLIVGPNGQVGLIDAGPPTAGFSAILPTLRRLEIDALSWVIISHYDADHLGGLLEVLRGEDQRWNTDDDIHLFGSVWDRGGSKLTSTPWFEDYVLELSEASLRQTLSVGQTFDLGQGALAQVVLVAGRYDEDTVIHLNANEENEASIAVLIEHDKFRYLSAGDLTGGGFSGSNETKNLESTLADIVGPVNVVHLNHHGSRTSSNGHYLDKLAPEHAIASMGTDNDHGHPHAEVIERLSARRITLHRTDEEPVSIKSDGFSYTVEQGIE